MLADCIQTAMPKKAYRAKTDTRAVRKNVSLPAWMAAMADKRHSYLFSFS
ncbi:MAG: hypothetical protein DUD27_09680 [Lachnospiraceae bacterium]|nr:MAG: hypothetical protein DUD27_09680 [Lachnospiraceae bacterium]